jgi:hypothetical protein
MTYTQEQKDHLKTALAMGATRGMIFNQAMNISLQAKIPFEDAKVFALKNFVEFEEYVKEVTK